MPQPPFRCTVIKSQGTEEWSNVYWLDAASMADAMSAANSIVAAERAVTYDAVLFSHARVDDGQPNTDEFEIMVINLPGVRTLGTTPLDPLFNVVVVDFKAGSGRPSRKFLRGCMAGGDAAGSNLSATFINLIQNSYATPLVNLLAYVDVDGQQITGGAPKPKVGMRQLKRRKKYPAAP